MDSTGQPSRPPLVRPPDGRWVAGVCAGVAEHLCVPVKVVRLGFVVAALVAGAGLVVYAFLWALTPTGTAALAIPAPPHRTAPTSTGGPTTAGASTTGEARPPREALSTTTTARSGAGEEAMRNVLIGLALVVVGLALYLQVQGVNLRLGLLIPLLAVGTGAVLAWSRLDDAERDRWLFARPGQRRESLVRLGIGVALAVVGLVALATQGRGLAGLWDAGVAALAVLAGVAFLMAPWVLRLWNDYRTEQTERIRATEKADIAAHLHDSVLQTLALIQRRAEDPASVVRLARAQERELRSWLYGGPAGPESTLASSATQVAHEVEDLTGVPVDLVATGDRPLDEHGTALVRALREALLNATRHGRPPVSAYLEVGADRVEAFVRDHGPGFDLTDVPQDRLGVRQSILGRMERHGGTAKVRRLEDGTEVSLTLPTAPTTPARPTAPKPTEEHVRD
ncbi:MAG TPA: PspC domain-containing protein [Segeticoccus sp.]|uniref:ATP-binding protein n=1 Tax=Segeticoccus sp. TaxID=2706531 RepID=UPI002D7F9754|nr:PspC domain-containing protein [Segeticoccus sp.]HET8601933.1 PspC domain-containing protein [Segeticoccus sp.]